MSIIETVNLNEIKITMRRLLRKTYRGWGVWHRIVKKYGLKSAEYSKTAVILMPKDDLENSYFALLYLDRFLHKYEFKRAILLIHAPILAEAAQVLCKNVYGVEYLSEEEHSALLQYFVACPFDPRFIVASLTEPNGRNGRLLIGTNGITAEEMVAIGVYQLIPFVQMERPIYEGENEAVRRFMELGGPYSGHRTTQKIR